jgi:hypothetical protein
MAIERGPAAHRSRDLLVDYTLGQLGHSGQSCLFWGIVVMFVSRLLAGED